MEKKTNKKPALGRGLSALLKDPENDINSISDKNADRIVGSVIEINLDEIEVNPFQPRTNFKEEELQELGVSIAELGVVQPVTVRKLEIGKYQLISGERRYRASKILKKETIPAYVRIANDQETLEMALVENIQRQDLDPIEVAMTYQRLIDEINLTHDQMSRRIGKRRSTITNYLRLLKLDPIIQTGIRDGFLTMGHGKSLTAVEDREKQLQIYGRIISNKMSVRQTEEAVKAYQEGYDLPTKAKKTNLIPDFILQAQKQLKETLSERADIKITAHHKGKIILPFDSKKQFEQFINLLKK